MPSFMLFVTAILFATMSSFICIHNSVEARRPVKDMGFWLRNMRVYHNYSDAEIAAATGISEADVRQELQKLHIGDGEAPRWRVGDRLLVMPYPGGRHLRIGFLYGAVDPQRETKVSVFCPWDI